MAHIISTAKSNGELILEFCNVTADMSMDSVRAGIESSGTYLNLLMRQIRVWRRSYDNCPDPLVGVGCVTFADHRLQVYQRRINRLIERTEAVNVYS